MVIFIFTRKFKKRCQFIKKIGRRQRRELKYLPGVLSNQADYFSLLCLTFLFTSLDLLATIIFMPETKIKYSGLMYLGVVVSLFFFK